MMLLHCPVFVDLGTATGRRSNASASRKVARRSAYLNGRLFVGAP